MKKVFLRIGAAIRRFWTLLWFRMDNIPGDHKIYRGIFNRSVELVMYLIGVYLLIEIDIGNGIVQLLKMLPCWDSLDLSEAVVKGVADIFLSIIGLNWIFRVFHRWEEKKWVRNHPDKVVKGEWLHIHDKPKVRIGRMTICQAFHTVSVKDAFNISPNVADLPKSEKTTWYYTNARLFSEEEFAGLNLLGCYASNPRDDSPNFGVHMIDEIKLNQETNTTVFMHGKFRDTIKGRYAEQRHSSDSMGDLYLFRITPKLKEYLYENGEFMEEKLAKILENKALEEEPFVRKLAAVISKHTKKDKDKTAAISGMEQKGEETPVA